MHPIPTHISRSSFPTVILLAAAVLLAAFLVGCARGPVVEERGPLLFPPPPESPRVQYLGSVSTPKDLPKRQSKFSEFILGPEPLRYLIAKPIAATLAGPRLYICDSTINTVFMYDLVTGEARPLLGDRGMGKIRQPNNIALDEQGRLLVADKARGCILIFGPDEKFIDAWGRPGEIEPVAVAPAGDRWFVVDIKQHRVEIWSSADGSLLGGFGQHGSAPGSLQFPTQIAVDADGNVWVSDTGNARVQQFSPAGEHLQTIGGFGRELGKFAFPKGMDVDAKGRVYVADSRFCNVQIFDDAGRLLLFFGGPGPDRGNLDLPAGMKIFPWPAGIPWLQDKLVPSFDPEFLLMVVSQKGEGYVNFFAVARTE